MERKNIPILMMLAAGAITCIITFVRKTPLLTKLVILFVVLLLFYGMGTLIKWAFDEFEKRNEQRAAAEREMEVEEEDEVVEEQ